MLSTQRRTFLYPTSRKYPFDEVCERIVRELEARHWDVPGLTVKFHDYGTGDQKYRRVSTIESDDFRLRFGRPQQRLGEWNDTGAVSDLGIPQQEIHVYDDESGPTYYRYVGYSWEEDRKSFFHGFKVNSKLNGEPRTYLKYDGSWRNGCLYPGQRAPYLVHDNDLGREYEPQGNEPRILITQQVMEEFRDWLNENVLVQILAHPVPDEPFVFAEPEMLPFPTTIGSLFTIGKERDESRIRQGQENVEELDPSDRYGLLGSGYRLVPLGSGDRDTPRIAYEGFCWCSIGDVNVHSSAEELHIPWNYFDNVLIKVTPKRANDVYIADFGPAEAYRQECFKTTERLSNEQFAAYERMPGRTIIPITEYTGGFTKPVVLINRELDFDEVEVLGKLPGRRSSW